MHNTYFPKKYIYKVYGWVGKLSKTDEHLHLLMKIDVNNSTNCNFRQGRVKLIKNAKKTRIL